MKTKTTLPEEIAEKYPATEQMAAFRIDKGLWHPSYAKKLRDLDRHLERLHLTADDVLVELGSGLTTTMFDTLDCQVITVDESQWITETSRWLPNGKVQFVESDVMYLKNAAHYLHEDYPDQISLLYVDGPDLQRKMGIDASVIASKSRIENLLFDMRNSSQLVFRRFHAERYTQIEDSYHGCYVLND